MGDFDPAATTTLIEQTLADWASEKPYGRIPKQYFPDIAGGLDRILTPDKANAVYVAGLAFPLKQSDADYAPVLIGNYVFGGGALSSRLGDRVRQQEGLSYGVGSFISADAQDARTSLTINAICNPANIEKVNRVIAEELAKLLADGVTPAELDRAKQGYLQQQQVSRTNDAVLAMLLTDNLFIGRNMSFYAELEQRITALDPAQVLAALKKYIDPQRLVVVDAGDFKAAEAAASK